MVNLAGWILWVWALSGDPPLHFLCLRPASFFLGHDLVDAGLQINFLLAVPIALLNIYPNPPVAQNSLVFGRAHAR